MRAAATVFSSVYTPSASSEIRPRRLIGNHKNIPVVQFPGTGLVAMQHISNLDIADLGKMLAQCRDDVAFHALHVGHVILVLNVDCVNAVD